MRENRCRPSGFARRPTLPGTYVPGYCMPPLSGVESDNSDPRLRFCY